MPQMLCQQTGPMVTMGLNDALPVVAPGTMVEIVIVERQGSVETYTNLLVNPHDLAAESALAAGCLLDTCFTKYKDGRQLGLDHHSTGHWSWIIRVLRKAAALLEEYLGYSSWPNRGDHPADLAEQARTCIRLLTALQETMLNLLKDGVSAEAQVWPSIDESLADIVRRAIALCRGIDRVVETARAASTVLRFLSIRQYLASPISVEPFRNHEDYLQASRIAQQLKLDLSSLRIGVYTELAVAGALRGIKP